MADKIFCGKVFEDKWNNPEVNLTAEDLDKLRSHLVNGKVKLSVKKSQAGKWYSEINTFQPSPQNAVAKPYQANSTPVSLVDDEDASVLPS